MNVLFEQQAVNRADSQTQSELKRASCDTQPWESQARIKVMHTSCVTAVTVDSGRFVAVREPSYEVRTLSLTSAE